MIEGNYLWPVNFFGLSIGLLSGAVFATDLLHVYQLAQQHDKTFSAARNEFEAVKQTQRQANGLYYPNVAFRYDRIETDQQINRSDNEVYGTGKSSYATDDVSLTLTQPIFRWDYFTQRKVAKAEVRQAEYQFTAAEQDLMLRTAEAYLLSLAAADNEFVTRTELESMGQQLKLAQKRLEVGLGNATEVYESRARVEFTQSEVIAAENTVVDREEGLRTIIGEAPGDLMPLRDDFQMAPPDPADADMWMERAAQSNLTLRAAEAAVEVASAEHKLQQADRYPTVGLVADFNNRDAGGSLFGGGSDVDTDEVLLRAEWTIFQGGILRARIKEALYQLQRAQDDLERERRNVRREARNAYLGVVSNIAKASALKSSLDAQALTVQAKQKGFETGANSNIQVLDAKRDFFVVQRDYLKARYDYLLSLLNLKQQIGSLSPDDLEMINGLLKTASINSVSELKRAQAVPMPAAVTDAPGSEPEFDTAPGVAEIAASEKPQVGETFATPTATDAGTVSEQRQIESHLWLFDQSPDQFSIQTASVDAEHKAEHYIVENNLPDAHYFLSPGIGQFWYYVLSGSYASYRDAQNAADALALDQVLIRKISAVQTGRCNVAASQPEVVAQRVKQLCSDSTLSTGGQ